MEKVEVKNQNIQFLLRKNPGFIKHFVKFETEQISFDRLETVYNKIRQYKQLFPALFETNRFDNFESLDDYISLKILDSEKKSFVKQFISNKYSHLINDDTIELFHSLKQTLNLTSYDSFHRLVISKIASFKNSKDFNSFLQNLSNSSKESWDFDSLLYRLSVTPDVAVIYNDSKSKILAGFGTYKSLTLFGSENWCIYRSQSYFDSYTNNNTKNIENRNIQYIIFDTEHPKHHNRARLGITANINTGNITSKSDNKNSNFNTGIIDSTILSKIETTDKSIYLLIQDQLPIQEKLKLKLYDSIVRELKKNTIEVPYIKYHFDLLNDLYYSNNQVKDALIVYLKTACCGRSFDVPLRKTIFKGSFNDENIIDPNLYLEVEKNIVHTSSYSEEKSINNMIHSRECWSYLRERYKSKIRNLAQKVLAITGDYRSVAQFLNCDLNTAIKKIKSAELSVATNHFLDNNDFHVKNAKNNSYSKRNVENFLYNNRHSKHSMEMVLNCKSKLVQSYYISALNSSVEKIYGNREIINIETVYTDRIDRLIEKDPSLAQIIYSYYIVNTHNSYTNLFITYILLKYRHLLKDSIVTKSLFNLVSLYLYDYSIKESGGVENLIRSMITYNVQHSFIPDLVDKYNVEWDSDIVLEFLEKSVYSGNHITNWFCQYGDRDYSHLNDKFIVLISKKYGTMFNISNVFAMTLTITENSVLTMLSNKIEKDILKTMLGRFRKDISTDFINQILNNSDYKKYHSIFVGYKI